MSNIIKKAVIPAAGLGTRLIPYTKETPKEMLPIFDIEDSEIVLKPLIQKIFEELYSIGIRTFCFIVGRGKRVIEDYFTPDYSFIELLKSRKKMRQINILKKFYSIIENSNIIFINQHKPLGFGHAVLLSETVIGNDTFLVHAGDTMIISKNPNNKTILKMIEIYKKELPDIIFLAKEVRDPRMYGVIIGYEIEDGLFDVKKVIEKPKEPVSKLAIMPVYIFNKKIYDALKKVKPSERGEIELTDGIEKVIEEGGDVLALKISKDDLWIDVGTFETYRKAIEISIKIILERVNK